jgi:FKBP-type peptidyl-prolyl cis-trans isomerase FkpA
MESRTIGLLPAHRVLMATIAVLAAACGGGSAGTGGSSAVVSVPQPIAGDVERTTFSPSLEVDLSKMTRRASGLYVQDVRMGTGAVAVRGRTLTVSYVGWLPNGKEFDRGEITVTLGSNKVIGAWEEGLLGMRVGGVRRLVSPPNLAYGPRGTGDIPGNAVLVFQMEVTSVF